MIRLLLSMFLLFFTIPAYAGWQDVTQSQPYKYAFSSAAGVSTIKVGPGILHTLVVSGGTSGTIDLYDNTTIIDSFTATNTPQTYIYDISFSSGCSVVTGAATRIAVSYL